MKIDLVKLVEEVYKLEGEPKNVNKVFALICLQAFKEQLTLTDVGCSTSSGITITNTSSGITITNVDIQLLKRQWWQIYKKGWHKHQDFYNRKWWIKYNG
jgi:hypothetical protein